MNIYKISQDENIDYDTYDSAIVAAENEEIARRMSPDTGKQIEDWKHPDGEIFEIYRTTWCSKPELVTVKLIGKAVKGTEQGVILASFNAG